MLSKPLPADVLDTISHGVRTPLMVITTNAQLIRRSLPPEQSGEIVRRSAGDIVRAANRLLHLFEDLVDFQRLREAPPAPQLRAVQLHELLQELAADPGGALGNHPLQHEIAPELPAVLVDPVLLGRSLRHLLSNAAASCNDGDPILLRALPDGGGVRIEIVDHGRGIDPADQERIFEPFVRLPGSRGGAGIGLFLVRSFVEAMGGAVTVQSAPQRGSTFAVTLPAIA